MIVFIVSFFLTTFPLVSTVCSLCYQGYKVYYTLTRELPVERWNFVEGGNSLVTTISNLLTNRTYSIAVLAYTAVGNGPASEPVTIVTQQGGWSQIFIA